MRQTPGRGKANRLPDAASPTFLPGDRNEAASLFDARGKIMTKTSPQSGHTPVPQSLFALKGEQHKEQRWIEIRHEDGTDTDLRDLNLYAAAPETKEQRDALLEAAKEALKAGQNDGQAWKWAPILRLAITRAGGKP